MKLSTLRPTVVSVGLVIGLTGVIGLAACGSSSSTGSATGQAAGPRSTADTGTAAAETPVDAQTLAAARKEGSVLLYTNADEQLMKPVREGFKTKYPDIELRVLDLSDPQIFQRYATEKATGARTADLVMTTDAVGMLDFVKQGNVENYTDPNVKNLPEYAQLAPGVVAMSEDPVIAVYNTALLPKDEQPVDMAGLAALAGSMKGKVGTTDISNAVQFGAVAGYLHKSSDAGWKNIETIGPNAGVESGNGNLITKLLQGEYVATYFVAGTVRALVTGDAAKVVNYAYLKDGTPLLPRAIAVTAAAGSPNAAKVFVNYLLSVEGQTAACKGGFTPYRAGVSCPFGITAIEEAVGKDNMIIGSYDPALVDQQAGIVSRWNAAFGR